MKIYGHTHSPATLLVLATLNEKGHRAELVMLDMEKGEHKQIAHRRRHPFGIIPTLEDDDGFTLYESRAIARYLDLSLPGPRLTPTDVRAHGLMEQWIGVEQSYFSPAVMRVFYPLYAAHRGGPPADMQAVGLARADVAQSLEVLDQALADRDYLTGEFSLADLCFMPFFATLEFIGAGDVIPPGTRVQAWWQRLRARPAWQALLPSS